MLKLKASNNKKSKARQNSLKTAVNAKKESSGNSSVLRIGLVISIALLIFYWVNNQNDPDANEPVIYLGFKELSETEKQKLNSESFNDAFDQQFADQAIAEKEEKTQSFALRLEAESDEELLLDNDDYEEFTPEGDDKQMQANLGEGSDADKDGFIPEKPEGEVDNILSFESDSGNYVPAPANGFFEESEYGNLPIISKSGKTSYQIYSSMNDTGLIKSKQPIIAFVVGGMGISSKGTGFAINNLDSKFTLAFAPYGENLQNWVDRARSAGHEVMLQIPMEPFDYPNNDPGPHTLLSNAKQGENLAKLNWSLARFSGYTGIMNYMGAKFTRSNRSMTEIAQMLKKRGLLYLDDGSINNNLATAVVRKHGVPTTKANKVIDAISSKIYLTRSLKQLEELAKKQGHAVGVGNAYPLTLKTLTEWSNSLEIKGIKLVPLTMVLARKQANKLASNPNMVIGNNSN